MDPSSIFLGFLLVIIGLPLIALIGWAIKQQRANQYVLKFRAYPSANSATRKLTDDEWNKVAESVPLIDIKDGPLAGMPVVDRADLKKACEALAMEVDSTWLSEVDNVHYVALRYIAAAKSVPAAALVDSARHGAATTRGARAASANGAPAPAASAPAATDASKPADETTPWYRQNEQERINRAQGGGATPKSWTPNNNRDESESSWGWGARRDKPFQQHSFSPRAEMLTPPRTPKVLITPEAYKRMLLYVEFAPKEVGWLGTAKLLENGDMLIDMTYLIEQEVTAVETELSTEGQSKLCMELMKKNGMAEGMKVVDSLRFWGHSHVRMEVFPSSTDENTMITKGRDGHEWFIRGIFNKHGKAKFDIYRFDRNYRFLDVPWVVVDPGTMKVIHTEEKRGFWAGVFSAKAKTSVPVTGVAKPAEDLRNGEKAESGETATAPEAGAKTDLPATEVAQAATAPATEAKAEPTTAAPATTIETTVDTTSSGADLSALVGESAPSQTPAAEPVKAEPPAPIPHYLDALPDVLRPDAALRAEVQAEYDAKVDERTFRATIFKSAWDTYGTNHKPDLIDDRWVGDDSPGSAGTKDVPSKDAAAPQTAAAPAASDTAVSKYKAPTDIALDNFLATVKAWFAKLFMSAPEATSTPPAKEKKEEVKAPTQKKDGKDHDGSNN